GPGEGVEHLREVEGGRASVGPALDAAVDGVLPDKGHAVGEAVQGEGEVAGLVAHHLPVVVEPVALAGCQLHGASWFRLRQWASRMPQATPTFSDSTRP